MASHAANQTEDISRRHFLRTAGLFGAAAAAVAAQPGTALAGVVRKSRPTVAVFGGGIAGLTAAHELAERGFDVTVYERRAWGGKARSIGVPDSATDGRRPLPGEHGYRMEFGFYQNLPDTLRRIPFGSNPNGVFDNLVSEPQAVAARQGARELVFPVDTRHVAHTPDQVTDLLVGLLLETDLPPEAVLHFADRLGVYMSSCDARRLGQWEHTRWDEFIGSNRYSADYRKVFAETFSHFLQASKTELTSANFAAFIWELTIYTLLGRGADGPLIRQLDAPTNDAWIDPWLDHLRKLGVRLRLGYSVSALDLRDGRIRQALLVGSEGARRVRADFYVVALPVERARKLWSRSIVAADPRLERMHRLGTDWMNGIQFFLRQPTPIARGHVIYYDSPWLVTSISQAQFWRRSFASTYGDGQVHDCISAIVSEWSRPGVLFGKPARDCTPREVAREVWEQMKRHVNDSGEAKLTDDLVHSWFLDPGLVWRNGCLHSEDPLVLPSVGNRPDRPDVATAIPNLFLAGDYLEGDWQVANMEAANFNARRTANAILERSGSHESPSETIAPYRPPEWEAAKRLDEERYKRGKPNLLDAYANRPPRETDLALMRDLGLSKPRAALGSHLGWP